jgi:hypothetical protein
VLSFNPWRHRGGNDDNGGNGVNGGNGDNGNDGNNGGNGDNGDDTDRRALTSLNLADNRLCGIWIEYGGTQQGTFDSSGMFSVHASFNGD